MSWSVRFARLACACALLAVAHGCARDRMVLELRSTVLYEKPRIRQISHTLSDARADGGRITIQVQMLGDQGLKASFDIGPGVVSQHPMAEAEAGRYVGEFLLPQEVSGGPYSIVGRLRHEKAGEVIMRDSETLTIPLLDR